MDKNVQKMSLLTSFLFTVWFLFVYAKKLSMPIKIGLICLVALLTIYFLNNIIIQ